jgi:UPF0716 protein FxsA
MREIRLLFRFMDRDSMYKLIMLFLLFSLVPLAEIFLFIYLGELIGNYLVLIMAALAGVAGAVIALGQAERTLARLRLKTRQGRYPGREFAELVGIVAGAILLITPGFLTDICGYLLLIPAIRRVLRDAIARKLNRSFKEIYEYLRLSSL